MNEIKRSSRDSLCNIPRKHVSISQLKIKKGLKGSRIQKKGDFGQPSLYEVNV